MALPAGTRLDHYEIISPIGAGGMGEVYRTRDTKLRRDVAFKVLPESLAGAADRLSRFQREAQLVVTCFLTPDLVAKPAFRNVQMFNLLETLEKGIRLALQLTADFVSSTHITELFHPRFTGFRSHVCNGQIGSNKNRAKSA